MARTRGTVAMPGGGTRNPMPSGPIPGRITTQAGVYRNDGVSAFGNISKS